MLIDCGQRNRRRRRYVAFMTGGIDVTKSVKERANTEEAIGSALVSSGGGCWRVGPGTVVHQRTRKNAEVG